MHPRCSMRLPTALLTLAFAGTAWSQTYTVKTFAGGALPEKIAGASASLGNIYGMAIDSAGNLFLSLADYNIVVRMDAASGMLTRVAGNGVAGFSGDGAAAAAAQLNGPSGLAVDSAGNLYIADTNNARVRMVSPNGMIATFAGTGVPGYTGDGGAALQAQFNGLCDLAIDSSANLYIADYYNQAIRRVSGGIVSTVAGNGTYGSMGDGGVATAAQLAGPLGIAVDVSGNLWIAEGYGNRVRKVSKGTISTVAGTGTAGFSGDNKPATGATLRQPSAVALDSAGNLYIADFGNYRVRMVAPSGMISTVAGNGTSVFSGDQGVAVFAGLAAPRRVVTDASGNLYIADGCRVRKVAANMINTIAGGAAPIGEGGPAVSAQLHSPQGIATDAGGNVYLTDFGTGRVLRVSGGTLTRVAGTGNPGYSGDNGPATAAQLSGPSGLAIDPSNHLYVADSLNARIRQIASGAITTAAGGSGSPWSHPLGVAIAAGGSIYVSDLNYVRMISGGAVTIAAGNGGLGYQGDGGPASAAYMSTPSGVALDSAGNLYIADTGNNRIREVSNGVINTIDGNGTYGATSTTLAAPAGVALDSSGTLYVTDAYRVLKVNKGKITTIGGLNNPQGLAIDSAGNVYVAEPATHTVRVLSPAGTTCAATAAPGTLSSSAAGGLLSVSIPLPANCTWTVENLPAWITVSGNPFGTGPATAALIVAANSDAPRSAAIVAGGQSVTVNQAGSMTILGQVTLSTGTPVAGVTVTLSGGAGAIAASDSGGNYSFPGLDSTKSYTVTPSLSGYTFNPASLTFANVNANPAANFTAFAPPQVSAIAPVFGSALVPAPTGAAAGEIVSIYGTNLCSSASSASPTLPDRLAACIVQVDGTNVRLYYASPGQINAVLPQTLLLGSHQVVVQRYADTTYKLLMQQSSAFPLNAVRVAMAFVEGLDTGAPILAVQYTDGGFAGSTRPLHPGDTVTLYCTGIGRTAATFPEGAAPKATSSAVEQIQVTVQGLDATVLYAGVQPQFPGLDQITIQLPKYTLPSGKTTATIQVLASSAGQMVTYAVSSF